MSISCYFSLKKSINMFELTIISSTYSPSRSVTVFNSDSTPVSEWYPPSKTCPESWRWNCWLPNFLFIMPDCLPAVCSVIVRIISVTFLPQFHEYSTIALLLLPPLPYSFKAGFTICSISHGNWLVWTVSGNTLVLVGILHNRNRCFILPLLYVVIPKCSSTIALSWASISTKLQFKSNVRTLILLPLMRYVLFGNTDSSVLA